MPWGGCKVSVLLILHIHILLLILLILLTIKSSEGNTIHGLLPLILLLLSCSCSCSTEHRVCSLLVATVLRPKELCPEL